MDAFDSAAGSRPLRQTSWGTYLARGGAAIAIAAAASPLPWAGAANLFSSQPLDASRFAVLARPVGANNWNLLVLEQIQPEPLCWEQRPDGLVDPALNRFNFTGICSRYLDSNGYSLRIGEQDLASRYRLQLRQSGSELRLEASSPSQAAVLVVAKARVPLRDRDGFVALKLMPGWDLQRRVYGEQTLSHIYFANPTPLPTLLARASGTSTSVQRPPLAPPPRLTATTRPSSYGPIAQGPIRLPVIPFRE